MPSIEEFRTLLETDANEAFRRYSLRIDAASLDYTLDSKHDDFKKVKVVFEYENVGGANTILMRADKAGKSISYLPWKNTASSGMAKATLDGTGPAYFSTSQLSGCRFCIQYHDADRKTVTVQHLAGDSPGGPNKQGSDERDVWEATGAQGLPATATPLLHRRLSIGSGAGKNGRAGLALRQARPETTYYDGGLAAVFGYRNTAGAWAFYGAETDQRTGAGVGLKNLFSKAPVTGSLKADAAK